uniref:DB domain-containing protein n=1 Tax=Angiostrongylus cantonensis TaxID=6313 RepID=A0A0K0DL65_ANGCA
MNGDEDKNVEFFQCLTSGVCGSGGGLCAPPPPLPCQPNACQPGYQCGQYGCARNRARSALTKKVEGIFISDEDDWKSKESGVEGKSYKRLTTGINRKTTKPLSAGFIRKQMDNVTLQKLTNPNFIFRKCCEQRGLPDACLSKCNFNFYTKGALQEMYFKIDGCPIEATADMHFCAAQGRDHTECCHQNGVATTLAGIKCLTFCDQRPNRITKLDYSYVPCYERFEQMKQCFYNEIRNKAQEQFGFT